MYKVFTKNGNVEAVGKGNDENSDKALVFFGKFGKNGKHTKFGQRTTNQSAEACIASLEANGFTYVGVATFTKSGRLITVDTFDTLYWGLDSSTNNAIARFKELLKSFVDILHQQTKQKLLVIEEEHSLQIDFKTVTLGIGISQKLNILNCAGKGCGQVSLSQSEEAIWLLLFLHSNGCIKLSTTSDEIQSKSQYPKFITEFSQSNKALYEALGLGCGLTRIKPLF